MQFKKSCVKISDCVEIVRLPMLGNGQYLKVFRLVLVEVGEKLSTR